MGFRGLGFKKGFGFTASGDYGLGLRAYKGLPTEAPRLDARGRPRRAARKRKPHPNAARSLAESDFCWVQMQKSINTTRQGFLYMKSTAGYHKAGARCVQLVDSILVTASGHQMGESIETKSDTHSSICAGRRIIVPAADW